MNAIQGLPVQVASDKAYLNDEGLDVEFVSALLSLHPSHFNGPNR